MAVVYAIHSMYEDEEIYIAYDSEYYNRWIGNEVIKRQMVPYYDDIEAEQKRVQAKEKKIMANRITKTKIRRDCTSSGSEARDIPKDIVSTRSRDRALISVGTTLGGRVIQDGGMSVSQGYACKRY